MQSQILLQLAMKRAARNTHRGYREFREQWEKMRATTVYQWRGWWRGSRGACRAVYPESGVQWDGERHGACLSNHLWATARQTRASPAASRDRPRQFDRSCCLCPEHGAGRTWKSIHYAAVLAVGGRRRCDSRWTGSSRPSRRPRRDSGG